MRAAGLTCIAFIPYLATYLITYPVAIFMLIIRQLIQIGSLVFTLSLASCDDSLHFKEKLLAQKSISTVHINPQSDTIYSPIDTTLYLKEVLENANGDTTGKWPIKKQPYPLPGAILPFKRIVAFYGNLYSKKMGILGELAPNEMLAKLHKEVKLWEKAGKKPVQPALHYIAVVAQGNAGADGMYRYQMPDHQIDSVLHIAKKSNAIIFLDLQVGLSNVHAELPRLEKYLKLPQVHLGIDPEFSMKNHEKPGSKIGTYDAADVNYCTSYLANLVRKNHLPPKVFILHRFTRAMLTNYKKIKLHPEVQFVMNMDGWGEPDLKKGTYQHFIFTEPIQFTGFKLFYKNDIKKPPHRMITPNELLQLKPKPLYIQYQ